MINLNLNVAFKFLIGLFVIYYFKYTFNFVTSYQYNVINKIKQKLLEVSQDISENNKNYSISDFNDIYPKVNLNSDKIIEDLSELFESRELFISDGNITNEYIRYIRPLEQKEEETFDFQFYKDIDHYNDYLFELNEELKLNDFYELCNATVLFQVNHDEFEDYPLISIILPSYNKYDEILKTVRSIQNQSFKNIEIIIVDDGSTDQSKEIYEYLLLTDSRIRVFYHLKNMGVWRTRLDGFLYSNGKYIIHLDVGDFLSNNMILEISYNLIQKYNLDSIRFSFKATEYDNSNIWNNYFKRKDTKIVSGPKPYDTLLYDYGTIWNRLIKANVMTKSLDLVDSYILNAYKNLWEDRWWNVLANYESKNYLMINKIGYLYIKNKGEGHLKLQDDYSKEKTMKEFIYFWLFDLELLPKEDNKKSVIKNLYLYNKQSNRYKGEPINLSFLKNKFPIYTHLLNLLINDPFVSKEDKVFLNHLLDKSKQLN